MTVYDHLLRFQPFLAGDRRWVGYCVVALPLAVSGWALLGRRWRPDGVRRCPRCSHAFDPAARLGADAPVRCTECGANAHGEAAASRRRGRRRLFAAGIGMAFLLALPFLAWHGVHVTAARLLLPRWVVEQRAELPSGLVLVQEADPVQRWLGWEPNPAEPDGPASFFDAIDDDGKVRSVWPDPMRIRAWMRDAPERSTSSAHLGPVVFGAVPVADPFDARMPPVGSPGFGGDLAGDGSHEVVVGEVNVGSGGGTTWFRIVPPAVAASPGGGPAMIGIGPGVVSGTFRRDAAHGDWVFDMVCRGFRYRMTPGAFSQDPLVTCTWEPARRQWVPNASRMRRTPDAALLAACAADAVAAYAECAAQATEAGVSSERPRTQGTGTAIDLLRAGRSAEGPFLPCPGMVGRLSAGALELALAGQGDDWDAWLRMAWPREASEAFRDRFIAEFRGALDACECSASLRELLRAPAPHR